MVSFKWVLPLLPVLVSLVVVNSCPTSVGSYDSHTDLNAAQAQAQAPLGFSPHGKNAVPSPPYFVVYSDRYVPGLTGPPPVAEVVVGASIVMVIIILTTFCIKGFNVLCVLCLGLNHYLS